jgi:hypothetical protein
MSDSDKTSETLVALYKEPTCDNCGKVLDPLDAVSCIQCHLRLCGECTDPLCGEPDEPSVKLCPTIGCTGLL